MKRKIVCSCGHEMTAADDEQLYKKVRNHVDDKHSELNYTKEDILEMIKEKAVNI